MLIGSKSLENMIPTFATIAYSPVRSFSPRLGLFSLKNWDRTATQSGPNFFGDRTMVRSRISRPDHIVAKSGPDCRTILRSGPKIWDWTTLKSVRSSPVLIPRSGLVSLDRISGVVTGLGSYREESQICPATGSPILFGPPPPAIPSSSRRACPGLP